MGQKTSENTNGYPIKEFEQGVNVQNVNSVFVKNLNRNCSDNSTGMFSKHNFNNKQKQRNNLPCFFTNADTLTNKMDELKTRILIHDAMIIGINEVLPKNSRYSPTNAELHIDGYDMFINNAGNDEGIRGTALYIRSELKATEVTMKTVFKEQIWVSMNLSGGNKLLVGCVYRSPSSSEENNRKLYDLITEAGERKYSHLVIMGDFNFKNIDWNANATDYKNKNEYKFVETVRDNYLFQHVKEPTRIRVNQEPSVLDLIFTNEENMVENLTVTSALGKSDHGCVKFNFVCKSDKPNHTNRKMMYNRGNYEKIREELEINWELLLNGDVDENYNRFVEKILNAADNHIPVRKSAEKQYKQPLDGSIVKAIHRKHRCWKRFMETKEESKYREYTKARNKVKNLVRNAKKRVEQNIAEEVKINPKKFWRYANSKTKTRTGIAELHVKDNGVLKHVAKSDEEKAEALVDFFSSVFVQEPVGEVPKLPEKEIKEVFIDKEITEEDIEKLIQSLNVSKSQGPDNIHSRLLKEVKNSITKPLKIIFNQSLSQGQVPKVWKEARITAIFKKGDKQYAGNYRPVSLTSVVCKMMEKIIRSRMMLHILDNQLLSSQQYGFVKGRSTVLQLLKVVDQWTEIMDEGGSVDVVYMDFMKAFDTVPHRRLLGKLETYGISERTREWIRAFLTDRKQQVSVNGETSKWKSVTSGIPQGSVLGPTLFVLYINDLPDLVDSTALMFADDTKLYRDTRKNVDMQKDLDNLQKWSDTWLLKFHPDKCHHMRIGNDSTTPNFHLYKEADGIRRETCLKLEEEEKDLGIIVDNKLNFRQHIQTAVNKANRILGTIRRTYTYLNERSFCLLYKALVRPHLEYGASIWNPHKIQDINLLENVQRRATKLIPGMKDTAYEERMKKLKLPSLKYRRDRGDMIEVFKIVRGFYDKQGSAGLVKVHCNKRTRGNSYCMEKARSRLDIRKYSFSQRVVNDWNSLPEEIVQSPTLNTFENRLDKYWQLKGRSYTTNNNHIIPSGSDIRTTLKCIGDLDLNTEA